MNTTPNDGGPAFPRENNAVRDGMSLRDYFAAKVLQGCMAGIPWESNGQPLPVAEATDYALMSYQLADAMLKARSA